MVPRKLVSIILDPDSDDEPIYCTYDINGKFIKIRDLDQILGNNNTTNDTKKSNTASLPKIQKSIENFFNLDLPYISYHDVNPFELMDDDCNELKTRFFLPNDTILERDRIIGNEIGLKTPKERVERPVDHHYLPGKPNLIYENYPFFKPNLDKSIELTNEEFYKKFITKFNKTLSKKLKNFKTTQTGDSNFIDFENYIYDLPTFQTPVDYPNYFTIYESEFFDVFNDRIINPILKIYQMFLLNSSTKLKKYLEETDEEYSPILNNEHNVSLKPIGSVGVSSFPFGLVDPDTKFLNSMFVHVELVNLSLGIGEGYELYFQSQKQNFQNEFQTKIFGSNSTKINNFLKYFHKCCSICLNSQTNRFIITDYYWIGVFQIEDIEDGEIQDVKKLISKVNVLHFSYSNFESEDQGINGLSIRSIIASWFNISSNEFKSNNTKMNLINSRIIKEWELFQKSKSMINNNTNSQSNKRLKISPFIYTTPSEIKFLKKKVDLEKSLVEFIAIGYEWSCQTLCIDLKKLFHDKQNYYQIFNEHKLSNSNQKVLLSIYDEQYNVNKFKFLDYYKDDKKLIINKSNGNMDTLFGLPLKTDRGMDESFTLWHGNIDIYNKLKFLQGDIIARVLDFGYLEDKSYNDLGKLHFKIDGYYIIYEPNSMNFKNLIELDINNEDHYLKAKETITKIHEYGVTFQPKTKISLDVLRFYNNKVFLINLEETSWTSNQTSNSFKSQKQKDLNDLDIEFKKKTSHKKRGSSFSNGHNIPRRKSSSHHHNHNSRSSLNQLLQHLRQEVQLNPGTLLDEDDIEGEVVFSEDE
ncbi:hypothetical protein BN7_1135 [Wickerhamomyces ciferrii]|uniref:Uncharacterized protein n=1 Tax=Wickerhamomyces ciferrii (strain ATCC 14091 / BCRC 22168 / CBS 111 / JCM 3599 / NBRC 0793 / NRRL Y-1031 F-60-10) TaxID=1206466 RepID=K0KJC9_WICCF|nr:uncharacterized protein BN7_1135 [Wickerhamomyces ciferrii]CCH41594.1 hypothetical protein BN7_1135 [Wickerhamomyces ciferrii]